jgi:hypothetical protein
MVYWINRPAGTEVRDLIWAGKDRGSCIGSQTRRMQAAEACTRPIGAVGPLARRSITDCSCRRSRADWWVGSRLQSAGRETGARAPYLTRSRRVYDYDYDDWYGTGRRWCGACRRVSEYVPVVGAGASFWIISGPRRLNVWWLLRDRGNRRRILHLQLEFASHRRASNWKIVVHVFDFVFAHLC